MTPAQHSLISRYLQASPPSTDEEAVLLPALMGWLITTGRLGAQTLIAHEVPWLGRRVDLALLTARGIATAFELKLGRLQRVVEQAAYNRSSFHRSWIVTASYPREAGLGWVTQLGLGLIVVKHDVVTRLTVPRTGQPHPAVRERLRGAILRRAVAEA